MRKLLSLAALSSALLLSCSPADWALARNVGVVAGQAVDAMALGRAEQIRARARDAAEAAARGDDLEAMQRLNEALADLAAGQSRELARLRATCPVAAPSSLAPVSP